MSNTWTGMVTTNIAREGFDALLKALVPLDAFSRDFSTDIPQGKVVQSRIVPASTAQDLENDHSGDYSAAAGNTATTQVQVTLDKHPVDGFHLTDKEAQEIASGVWSDTARRIVRTKAYSVAKSFLDSVFAGITADPFTSGSEVTIASFDEDDVVDLRQEAINAGWVHSPENSVLMVNPAMYASLLKADLIKDYSASQSDALRSGQLPSLGGFRVIEAPTLPHNDEGLVGFIAQADAMAVAIRGVQTQAPGDFLDFQLMQDDVTGIVMAYAAWFDRNIRKVNHTFEVYGGSARGNVNALRRLYVSDS